MSKFNVPFVFVLTAVWLVLLSFCALIGILIVPVDPAINSQFVRIMISSGKVILSLLVILLWLLGWYKMMDVLLNVEFYLAETSIPTDD